MYVSMYGCMDVWTCARVYVWMYGWMHGGCMNGGWLAGWMDGWMFIRVDAGFLDLLRQIPVGSVGMGRHGKLP